MNILSIRRGFLADHSSTSYEFLAVDKPLNAKARAAVSQLSSRVHPTSRRASFVYHVDGYDIPGGWGALMATSYDVMYSESYDWWTLAVAFNTTSMERVSRLHEYAFRGVEDLGVDVDYRDQRAVVTIYCRLDPNSLYLDSDEDGYEEDDDEPDDHVATADPLLGLLVRVRERLKKGDCQALYAVWDVYGDAEEDREGPPRPRKTKAGTAVAAELARLLAPM
jgi:hypothetical protein